MNPSDSSHIGSENKTKKRSLQSKAMIARISRRGRFQLFHFQIHCPCMTKLQPQIQRLIRNPLVVSRKNARKKDNEKNTQGKEIP